MGRATEAAAQILRSSRLGTAAANQFLAEAELHARSQADLIGVLRAQVLSLSADLAVARMDGLSTHQKAVALVGEAQSIVDSWTDHPIAGDEASGVAEALQDAQVGLEATFFDIAEAA